MQNCNFIINTSEKITNDSKNTVQKMRKNSPEVREIRQDAQEVDYRLKV